MPVAVFAQGSGRDTTGTGGNHIIQGKIFYPSGRRAEGMIQVQLQSYTAGEISTMADSSGSFTFTSLSPGNYTVVVNAGDDYEIGREGVSIRALADHTQLAATHVTTEVGRLIGKGLLTKQASTRDRRSVLVRLSRKGEAAIRAVNPLLRRVNDRLFQNVSREEFAVVSRFLETFALNSEDALAEIRRAERERGFVAARATGSAAAAQPVAILRRHSRRPRRPAQAPRPGSGNRTACSTV